MALTKLSNIHNKFKKEDNKVVYMAGKKFGDDFFSFLQLDYENAQNMVYPEQTEAFKIMPREWRRGRHVGGNDIFLGALIMPTSAYKRPEPQETFKLTEHLSLGLFDKRTEVLIDGKRFMMCKYLILNIPVNKTKDYDNIKSIDHLISKTGNEERHIKNKKLPSAKTRFWGHCSNFQVWVEHDYDTRLIDSRLAFPILRRLQELGDPTAKRVFKEELVARILEGYNDSFERVRSMGLLGEFTIEELKTLKQDLIDRKGRYTHIDNIQHFIEYRQKYIKIEIERKKNAKLEKARLKRLEAMWKKQEANVRANERKIQRSLLYWMFKTPETAVSFFKKAYREFRWLEQMLKRHSVGQIAKRASVSKTTIYYWIKKHNISVKGIKNAVRLIRDRRIKFKIGGK